MTFDEICKQEVFLEIRKGALGFTAAIEVEMVFEERRKNFNSWQEAKDWIVKRYNQYLEE